MYRYKSPRQAKHFETFSLAELFFQLLLNFFSVVGGPSYLIAEWQWQKDPDL